MASFLKMSEACSLAIHAMVILAINQDVKLPNNEIARMLGASRDHLSKVLQRLSKAGYVHSERGPGGGFMIAGNADEVTLLDIYQAIEGSGESKACLLDNTVCAGRCILGDLVVQVNSMVLSRLSETKLSDFVNAGQTAHGG